MNKRQMSISKQAVNQRFDYAFKTLETVNSLLLFFLVHLHF